MSKFSHTTDEVEGMGFISKEKILQYVTEEQIFELVFGFKPIEFEYVTSPIRVDNNPGCWFEVDITTQKLMFRDFGYGKKPLDCFDIVQKYYKIPNFYKTLVFVKSKLIDGKNVSNDIVHKLPKAKVIREKKRVEIYVQTRDFIMKDKVFWQPLEITKAHLIEDKVFPIQRYKLTNTKKGDVSFRVLDLGYVYTEFKDSRKKIYRPHQDKYKFITNCIADDVGGYDKLVPFGRQLVITKAYKDYRVLINQGLNAVWLQNEGMYPSIEILTDLAKRFNNIIILFDNDSVGIEKAEVLVAMINTIFPGKARKIHLPTRLLSLKQKDPSDLIRAQGRSELRSFLTYHKLF